MANKLQQFNDLFSDTLLHITSDTDAWVGYLRSISRHYKYTFSDVLLIYAQRPNASACATMETWNKWGRWVNAGARGIALLDTSDASRLRLRYVFDVSDTNSQRGIAPRTWEFTPDTYPAVTETLANAYQVETKDRAMPDIVTDAAEVLTIDNGNDYLRLLTGNMADSRLDGLSESDRDITFLRAVYASVAAAMLFRGGWESEAIKKVDEQKDLLLMFNTKDTASLLCGAVCDIAEMGLREIESTVRAEQKKKIRTFANSRQMRDNGPKEETQPQERSQNHGTDVHEEGRLPAARPDAGRDAEAGQVRTNAPAIPQNGEAAVVRDAAGERTVGAASGGGAEAGNGAGEAVGGAHGRETERDRGTESPRPDGVGGPDEQHPAQRRGEREGGPDLYLNRYFDQLEHQPPADPQKLRSILAYADSLNTKAGDILDYLTAHPDPMDRADYIRGVFNDVYTEQILPVWGRVGYKRFDRGLEIWDGSYGAGNGHALVPWSDVAEQMWQVLTGVEIEQSTANGQELPSLEQQAEAIKRAETEKVPALSYSQEQIDNAILTGSHVADGKLRIYEQFQKHLSADENAAFLKKEYGIGGSSGNKDYPDISFNDKGLYIGSSLWSRDALYLSWKKVAKRISALIEAGRYLTDEEKAEYAKYRAGKTQDKPEQTYRYHLGDTVYIGKDEYTISGIGDPMRLHDETFPLVDTEMPRAEFERKVRENPRNDHLLGAGETEQAAPDEADDFSDIDPAAIRAELAKRGIVDGQVVDKAANDASPFISQVMQDVQRLAEEENPVPDISEHPITREGDTVTIGDGPATHEVTVTLPDEEWEQVKEAVLEKKDTDAGQTTPKYRIGTKVYIDNRLYEVVQSNEDYVVIMDRTVPNPPHRQETTEQFTALLRQDPRNDALFEPGAQEQSQPDYTVEPVAFYPGEKSGMPFDVAIEKLHTEEPDRSQPVTPAVPAQNFRITDDTLGHGGAKAKYAANIAAIKTLRTVESEHRNATSEEQEILSRYVGWGGVADAFDPDKPAWEKEYQELKDLLTPDEYNSARSSTLNAHYTSPTVIRAMYQVLENIGFRSGNILEPSCGVGNFFGMLPENMAGSKLYGVELDSLTGRIAKLLYPKADITVAGFETTNRRDFYDVAIGNVPFGQYQVNDPAYNKLHFSIHNYFFAKALDQVRPGGVVAFVVSRYLMDAKDPTVRKYLAQRAELLGAVRLPNTAFKDNANTEVVTDVLFFQKREQPIVVEPDWVHLGQTEHGIPINSYYIDHMEMVLGLIATESTQYGHDELTILPIPGADFAKQLDFAVQNITGRYEEIDLPELAEEDKDRSIPADPNVRNFSFTLVDGEVYYRENSRMNPVQASSTALNRIRGLVELRDSVQRLIDYQMEDAPDEIVQREQARLNQLYDAFSAKYGLINSRGNEQAFSDDSSYFLLCSLEILDKDGNLERKADFFTKRTIRRPEHVAHVDTASEALTLSLNEKGRIDMEYMEELTGKPAEQMESDLQGVIFRDTGVLTEQQADSGAFDVDELPLVPADEYLSGNVRKKLAVARAAQKAQPVRLAENVTALEKVQPVDLTASEISVRLGATWIPVEVIQQFMYYLLEPPYYFRNRIQVHYAKITGEWYIDNKSMDRGNVAVTSTYGTSRANAYRLLEDALNLRDTKIFDYVEDEEGKKKAVLNKDETTIAQQKQDLIRQAFADWIWENQYRRDRLCKLYNEKFNSLRPREYDGSHLTFPGMNPQIKLRPHQTNAIAHILYGGNTLLAHCVGAGKTYEMAAAAMESKRLGLSQKALFVVPNHIISQWASEFLQLYPSANLLVARKKDFETKNRKKFCGRIATGDYDAIIIGHSQFEKIAMSLERQRQLLESQINEIIEGIEEIKYSKTGERSTIKSLERTRKSLQVKLDKLNNQSRKDDVIDFEALGVDRLFIDEAHYYKNLFLYSKMRNVSGIAQTEAQKSSDLFLKCRYLDEKTGNHGVVFATGTPVSNSMVELYTMQRYLQYDRLAEQELVHFDAWASTFGETVTAIELAPEGTGYRAKTRFARFYNLPELMSMFKQVADVQTADMLDLDVPQAKRDTIALQPSEHQKELVESLSKRADRVRNRMVNPSEDNMLCITNDGRKLALDQRLMDPMLPDDPGSKVVRCAEEVFKTWQETEERRSTQLVFCDLSTPKEDGSFSVYNDLRDKLIEKGIPAEEIAFVHSAKTEVQKEALFDRVRAGDVRVLMGSTFKMGAGTNVQQRLIRVHHLDCPWRPADLEQRNGRIIRQGNENPEVEVTTYVTKNTFDAYLYQLVESKQKFIAQIMTSKSPVRSAEDVDESVLSYAEIKALATGNPYIKEKMDLDIAVSRLKLLKSNHLSERYALEDRISKGFPAQISAAKGKINALQSDIAYLNEQPKPAADDDNKFPGMTLQGMTFEDKKTAGAKLIEICKNKSNPDTTEIGMYRGFTLRLFFDVFAKHFKLDLCREGVYLVELGEDPLGNLIRIDNALAGLPKQLESWQNSLTTTQEQLAAATEQVKKPFPQEQELAEKLARLSELNKLLDLDKKDHDVMDTEPEEQEICPARYEQERSR